MKLLFVRHGKTEGNITGTYVGQSDSPLVQEGIDGAHYAAQQLRSAGTVVDAIYCSKLSRQYKTACIIADDIGFRGVIQTTDLLLERGGGTLEGISHDDFFAKTEQEQIAAGAESLAVLEQRARAMLEIVNKRHADDTVLLVGSSTIGEMLLAITQYNDPTRMRAYGNLPNTEVVQLLPVAPKNH